MGHGSNRSHTRCCITQRSLGLTHLHAHLSLLQVQARAVIATARTCFDLALDDATRLLQFITRSQPHLIALLGHQQLVEGMGRITHGDGHRNIGIGRCKLLAKTGVFHAHATLAKDGNGLLHAPLFFATLA